MPCLCSGNPVTSSYVSSRSCGREHPVLAVPWLQRRDGWADPAGSGASLCHPSGQLVSPFCCSWVSPTLCCFLNYLPALMLLCSLPAVLTGGSSPSSSMTGSTRAMRGGFAEGCAEWSAGRRDATGRAKCLGRIFPIHGEFSKTSHLRSSRMGAAGPNDSPMGTMEKDGFGVRWN